MWKFGRSQLFFASPVFGPGDRVEGGGGGSGDGLPAELQGKSAAEIAAYYQRREADIRRELTPPAPAPSPTPSPTNADYFNNPQDAVNRQINAVALTKEQWDATAAALRPSLIWAAKEQIKQRHKDFDRVEATIMKVIEKTPVWQQTDPNMWETAYIYAKGSDYERLSTEDRVRPPSSEPVVAAGASAPPPLADLATVTLPGLAAKHTAAHVADALGVSHDSYRKSKTELDNDGLLPLTYDNRRNK